MQWASSIEDDRDVPVLLGPDGSRYLANDPAAARALAAAFGRELSLRPEGNVQHHDETPLHLVTTSSLAALERLSGDAVDERRFRANIVIDTGAERTFHEDDWAGAELAVGGEVAIRLGKGMSRCVMVDQPQSSVSAEPKTLKLLGTHNSTEFGMQAPHCPHRNTPDWGRRYPAVRAGLITETAGYVLGRPVEDPWRLVCGGFRALEESRQVRPRVMKLRWARRRFRLSARGSLSGH